MEPIVKGAPQISIFPRSKRGCNQTGVPEVLNDIPPREGARHNRSGIAGSHFKVRDEQDKLQRGINIESGDSVAALRDDCKSAEQSRRGIVWMAFQFRAERTKHFLGKTTLSDPVQRHQDTQTKGDAAAESSRLWNVARNR